MHPVDEFAMVKAQIQTLEARADQLRSQFLKPGAALRSNQHEVTVRQQTRRIFLKDRLPPAILADPRYWEERSSPVVTLRDAALRLVERV